MKVSRKTMVWLLLLFAGFTVGTIVVRMSTEKETAPAANIAWYLTAYEDADDILAVALENETGSLTIVHTGDTWITDTQMPGVEPDLQAVSQLFEAVSTIRMNGKVEGANPADPQFGLDTPAATVLVEDQTESAIQFQVGSLTPDGSAYYACATGGTEVFTLSDAYGQAFLGDVTQYLDLRVLAGKDLSGVTAVTVSDAARDRTLFSLSSTGRGNVTGMKYYSLTEPVRIPMAASLCRENVFSPMEEMRAVTVTQGKVPAASGLTEEGQVQTVLTLAMEDGSTAAYLIGETGQKQAADLKEEPDGRVEQTLTEKPDEKQSGGSEPEQQLTDVTDLSTGVTYHVPSAMLAWLDQDAAQLLGGKLLSLNTGSLDRITLESQGKKIDYELTGSGSLLAVKAGGEEVDASDFAARILDSLNRISVRMIQSGSQGKAEEVLRCTILTGKGEETTVLVFEETDDRRCHVSVNGKETFECDRSSLQPLIEAAAGA